jgi:transcription elongation factor Elf1
MVYDVYDVIQSEYNLESLECLYCGSHEVTFHQYVAGGDAHCANCGRWQFTGDE